MVFNYQEIYHDLVVDLRPRLKEVVVRRFGLEDRPRETLQSIAQDFGITRERVRQIQLAALKKIKPRIERHRAVFHFFSNQLESSGKLRREDVLLDVLGPGENKNLVFFLLFVGEGFDRFLEDREMYTSWTIDRKSLVQAQKVINKALKELKKVNRPLAVSEVESLIDFNPLALVSFLEISKRITRGPDGLWGLVDWPEINPRSTRDRAYLVLQKTGRPLHFTEVAELIDQSDFLGSSRKAHPQTVHNELIKDPQFVLVGRGIYALKEWGYQPGVVKDIIIEVLRTSQKPLSANEIVEQVLKQRLVRRNTILLNLRDPKLFTRDDQGRYSLKI